MAIYHIHTLLMYLCRIGETHWGQSFELPNTLSLESTPIWWPEADFKPIPIVERHIFSMSLKIPLILGYVSIILEEGMIILCFKRKFRRRSHCFGDGSCSLPETFVLYWQLANVSD